MFWPPPLYRVNRDFEITIELGESKVKPISAENMKVLNNWRLLWVEKVVIARNDF